MKKFISGALAAGLCLTLTACGSEEGGINLWPVLFGILAVLVLGLAGLRTYSWIEYNKRAARRQGRRRKKRNLDQLTMILYGVALLMLLLTMITSCTPGGGEAPESTGETTTEGTTETTVPPVLYRPEMVAQSDPANWGITWEIFDGTKLLQSYERPDPITFGDPEEYFPLPGIGTFRGNNYRNSATYGTASITEKTLSVAWNVPTGKLPGSSWSGSGWTGQPLIVQWDEATKSVMNLYEEKKAKADLVEVIYATLEGKIYFLDLEDGSYTRDPINVGLCFKGAGSLDPRGYPLLYVGAGDVNSQGKRPRMHIISLIDGSILFEYGDAESLSIRKDNDVWCAFDSAPLVDVETDTLIWPGESGILYTIKLNTLYDREGGTISVSPDIPLVTRYNTTRSNEKTYWYGYEASVNMVENYLYVSENGGMFYCVDINTMQLVWAQDTKDDSNASPVFERVSEEEGYIYTAPSLHWTQDEDRRGTISLYKLNAITGEIVWETPYDVYTVNGVSGGVQSTPLLGKPGTSLEGLIIYSVSRTPNEGTGIIVALDTATGRELWRRVIDYYAWSSPVAVYDETGKGYVIVGDSSGKMHFLEGHNGTVVNTLKLNGLIEASPAVFNNMLVVGTRKEMIYGIQIK